MFFEQQVSLGIVIPPMIIAGIDETPTGSGEGMNDDALNEETEEGTNVKTVIESEFPMEGDASNAMGNPTAPIGGVNPQTRSGRTIRPPERLIQEIGAFAAQGATAAANYEILLTAAEIQYYDTMKGLDENAGEYGCVSAVLSEYGHVGAGLGGGFGNTQELHVTKYKEAMRTPDKPKWVKGVNEEQKRFKKHKCFKAVPPAEVPSGSKILTSTWAMKEKASGTFRARLNARGYEQVPGKHYDPNSIVAPVTSDVTFRIVLTLLVLAKWYAELIDVKGAFLHG
jgi:hypothetical protein